MLPHAPRTSFLIRDWEGCTTATNELPNPNQRSVVKTSGFLHPYIYRYTARVPRDRFLAFEGEGMTWMRQPSRQGIALFSVRMEFWRSTGPTTWADRSARIAGQRIGPQRDAVARCAGRNRSCEGR